MVNAVSTVTAETVFKNSLSTVKLDPDTIYNFPDFFQLVLLCLKCRTHFERKSLSSG
jgi:hypothetical protein